MRTGLHAALLALLCAATCACRYLSPIGQRADATGLARDAAARDAVGDGDAMIPADAPGISPLAEFGSVEAGVLPDQAVCGGPAPAPDINATATTCSTQCLSPATDADCDGLKNDPAPDTCNKLWLAEEYPPGSSAAWLTSGQVTLDCNGLTLGPGAAISRSVVPAISVPDVTYIVEARFTLGPTTDADSWKVAVRSSSGTSIVYLCELWLDSAVSSPGLHVGRFPSPNLPCSEVGFWQTDSKVDDTDGTKYILQMGRSAGELLCRLLDESGTQLRQLSFPMTECLPDAAGHVHISTTNRSVTLDYVRVFDL